MMLYVGSTSKKTKKQKEKQKLAYLKQQKELLENYKSPGFSKNTKLYSSKRPEAKTLVVSEVYVDKSRLSSQYPSLDTGPGSTAKKETSKYTGDNLIGIGMMHKSNLVPVFKGDEAKDLSSMRR